MTKSQYPMVDNDEIGIRFLNFLAMIGSPFVAPLYTWLFYWHFAARFGWPHIGYWEFVAILWVVRGLGKQFSPKPFFPLD